MREEAHLDPRAGSDPAFERISTSGPDFIVALMKITY